MTRTRAAVAIAAAVLAWAETAAALDGSRLPTQHMHDAWTEAEGLPQNSVKSIAQTEDGFLWIGTEEGLLRFDGASFRVFDRTTASGRTTNAVYGLAADGRGELVVLGGKDGLCTFREPHFACEPLPDGASGNALRRSAHDKKVHVATDRGLFVREATGFRRVDALGRANVEDVAFDPSRPSRLFAVTSDRGAVIVDDVAAQPVDLGGLSPGDVLGVARLANGSVWFGTRRGPRVLEGARLVSPPFRDVPAGITSFVRDDTDGNVWISIHDDGLYRSRGDAFVRVPLSSGQPTERLDTFFEDEAKNVWIGSRLSGLHRLRDGAFVPWGGPEGIAHGFVHSVWAHENGDVFVAAAGGGLYVIRGDRVVHAGPKEGLPAEGVDAFAAGKNGSLLVATRAGLHRIASFDPLRAELVPGTKDVAVTSALEEEDELWVGSATGLTATLRKKTYGAAQGLPSPWIGSLHRAKDGALWIGTAAGLVRLRGDTIDRPFADAIGRTTPASIAERPDGTLVVGTSDAGLLFLGGDSVRALGRSAGLFDDTVHVAIDGDDGRVWMTCNKGVYATPRAEIDDWLAGRRERVTSEPFARESGMRSRECNGGLPAGSRDPRGRLWFATMQGVVSVDPRAMPRARSPRIPVIDSARVAGRTILHPARVTLPEGARALEVVFTVAALNDADRTTFEVRVAGAADAAWHATSGRSASFASFAPGSYVVEVRARDASGATSPDAARLAIDVPPRFVETATFRVLAGGAALSIVLGLVFLRLRSAERARVRLARLVEERTSELASRNADLEERTRELRAALEDLKRAETDLVRAERMASVATLVRGIAHELNNPLAFVTGNVGPLRKYAEFLLGAIREVARGDKKLDDVRLSPRKDLAYVERDLQKLLADMEEGGRRARLIVSDLQSLTAPLGATSRAIEPVDVARVLEQSVRLLAPSKPEGVTIDVAADPCEPLLARAGEIEQAVVVVLDNALRAVGPKGKIGVRLRAEGDARIIEVEDDGPGMTEEVRKRATEPFFTTRAAGEGSGLGLAIAAQIAQHHRGAITIDSEPGTGTTVRLTVRSAT
jgi:signal transduction histidine kinase/ligand-binding sensor domain-containing protein